MKTKLAAIVVAFLICSCGSKLKTDYNCECKDLWSKIKGHEYEDFKKAWGEPIDKEENFEEKKVGYKYRINYVCSGTSRCGEIWLWFDAYRLEGSPDLLPMNNVHHAYCHSPASDNPRLLKVKFFKPQRGGFLFLVILQDRDIA